MDVENDTFMDEVPVEMVIFNIFVGSPQGS